MGSPPVRYGYTGNRRFAEAVNQLPKPESEQSAPADVPVTNSGADAKAAILALREEYKTLNPEGKGAPGNKLNDAAWLQEKIDGWKAAKAEAAAAAPDAPADGSENAQVDEDEEGEEEVARPTPAHGDEEEEKEAVDSAKE